MFGNWEIRIMLCPIVAAPLTSLERIEFEFPDAMMTYFHAFHDLSVSACLYMYRLDDWIEDTCSIDLGIEDQSIPLECGVFSDLDFDGKVGVVNSFDVLGNGISIVYRVGVLIFVQICAINNDGHFNTRQTVQDSHGASWREGVLMFKLKEL